MLSYIWLPNRNGDWRRDLAGPGSFASPCGQPNERETIT